MEHKLLDIRNVTAAMVEALIIQRNADAKKWQPLCDALEADATMTEQEKHIAAVKMAPVDMQHMVKLMESSALFEKAFHDTTHHLLRRLATCDGHECSLTVNCLVQSMVMGWQLAAAYLETQSLEQSVQ
jgi:hypothetical protein